MQVDWGLALGAVGVIVVPIAVGIGVTMANPTEGEFRFARGCFALAAILALAALGWLTYEHPLTLDKIIISGAVGAVVAVGLVVGLDWISRRHNQAFPKQSGGLYLECTIAPKPIKMPADGRIAVFNPWPIPLENGGGGFAESFLPAGSDFNLPGMAIDTYKCQITNYEDKTVFTVDFNFQLRFAEVKKQEGGALQSGATVLERPWLIRIGKIDPGTANSFVLYMHNNNSDRFVFVSFPNQGLAQRLGEEDQRPIRITTNMIYPIGLPPQQDSKPPEPKKDN
jgi:hypothetical protein